MFRAVKTQVTIEPKTEKLELTPEEAAILLRVVGESCGDSFHLYNKICRLFGEKDGEVSMEMADVIKIKSYKVPDKTTITKVLKEVLRCNSK